MLNVVMTMLCLINNKYKINNTISICHSNNKINMWYINVSCLNYERYLLKILICPYYYNC
jgi:hypothetical protein